MTVLISSLPSAAQACRVNPDPVRILEREYTNGTIKSVAVADIVEIIDNHGERRQVSWRTARAEIIGTIYGPDVTGTVKFPYNAIISSCNWPPLIDAGTGERIAIYLSQDAEGQRVVRLALDLSDVARFDPKGLDIPFKPVEKPDLR
jgi:hypothetical protein